MVIFKNPYLLPSFLMKSFIVNGTKINKHYNRNYFVSVKVVVFKVIIARDCLKFEILLQSLNGNFKILLQLFSNEILYY